uniref:Uncharacterized protein n=1 Tax=Glossina pallidipes TaxID=7398 RepID=A0A1A9Z4X2_GLOPL
MSPSRGESSPYQRADVAANSYKSSAQITTILSAMWQQANLQNKKERNLMSGLDVRLVSLNKRISLFITFSGFSQYLAVIREHRLASNTNCLLNCKDYVLSCAFNFKDFEDELMVKTSLFSRYCRLFSSNIAGNCNANRKFEEIVSCRMPFLVIFNKIILMLNKK